MAPVPPALAYRRAATQQASVVGLVIALYDTLAGDLQKASAAMRQQSIEERSRYLKHGFAVLTQLDSLIDAERGGETATRLRRFYSFLRGEMLKAQFTQDASILERSCAYLIKVREAWQEVDTRATFHSSAQTAEQGNRVPLDCEA